MRAALLSLLLATPQGTEDAILIRGARVVPVAGPDLENGSVLIQGGKIRKIGGPDLAAPAGALVLEAPPGAHVLPGFVDAHSHLGSAFEVEEPTEAVTPHLKAVDAFSSGHRDVRGSLGSGVTSVAIAPGNGNLVGGRIGVVKLNGARYDRALFRDAAALKASLSDDVLRRDREPTSRSGACRMLREFLGGSRFPGPLLVAASTPGEVHAALETLSARADGFVLVGARESGADAAAIAASGAAVAFPPLTVSDPRRVLETPGKLARAGVRVAFVSDAPRSSEEQLRVSAVFAVKYGMDRTAALRGLTTVPAALLGLSREIGSLEAGKDADVVIWSGDPLSLTSAVETVIVNGKVTWKRARP
jgi:imidazolonepropionase-like amidohydrolase